MRIGFDAKWLFSGHPSGKVFTQNILNEVLALSGRHTLVLFLKQAERSLPIPQIGADVEVVFVPSSVNLVTNALVMPWYVRKARLDLLVSMNFAVPFVGIRQMTVVFDVIFKDRPEYFSLREHFYFFFIKPLLRFATSVVTISEHCLKRMVHHRFITGSQKGLVLLLGVGEVYFTPPSDPTALDELRSKWALPESYVLYVGRINVRKNVPGMIQAISMIKNKRIGLVLCGKRDAMSDDMERIIKECGVEQRVQWLGEVPFSDLPLLYRGAKVFLYPSFEEGFGLPPLEAMASGVPVITSNNSSLPEVCGDAARYVDPADATDIARGLDEVLGDDALMKIMIQKGLKRAKELTWPLVGERFRSLIESSLISRP